MKRILGIYLWLLGYVGIFLSLADVFANIMVAGRYNLLIPFVPVALAMFLLGGYCVLQAWDRFCD